MALYQDGFTTKQINEPETVLCVPEAGRPRSPATSWSGLVMVSEDMPYDIFINVSVEGSIDLLGNPRTIEARIALLKSLGFQFLTSHCVLKRCDAIAGN